MPSGTKALIHKRKAKSQKYINELFAIPGVKKLVLTEEGQNAIFCIVGQDITSEDPWKYVEKVDITDDIEIQGDGSEWFPLAPFIVNYPLEKVLIWYLADETKDYDEFAICVTVEAEEKVRAMIQKRKEDQEARLLSSVMKTVRPWETLGSEMEMEEWSERKSRSLLVVELEGKYPVRKLVTRLRMRKSEQCRDGYVELISAIDPSTSMIVKRRIDKDSQIAPIQKSTEVQTMHAILKRNNSTQYNIDFMQHCPITDSITARMKIFNEKKRTDAILENLHVNININLYIDDFDQLVKKVASSDYMEAKYHEYMNIFDCTLFKDKMVSTIAWHEMWSGIVAVAYAKVAYRLRLETVAEDDEVASIVYGNHTIGIYTVEDSIKPRLLCAAPREVTRLAFCPYDANLLVGGLRNGQIIIWDLTGKLEAVETPDVTSDRQKMYKKLMWSMLDWIKNVHDISFIQPAALSDPKFSHHSPITYLRFTTSNHKINNLGKIEYCGAVPYQFMSAAKHGTLLVWDLLAKPKFLKGGFKPRKFRRLSKKPSSLISEESCYKELHLNLKPVYKVSLPNAMKSVLGMSLTTNINDNLIYVSHARKKTFEERVIYDVQIRDDAMTKPLIFMGGLTGEFLTFTWDGQDFNTGEEVTSEHAKVARIHAGYHDGPVVKVSFTRRLAITLTIGGSIFALWHSDYKDGPVLWRRMDEVLGWGTWDKETKTRFNVVSENGKVYSWSLYRDSQHPIFTNQLGNSPMTACKMHPRDLDVPAFNMGDAKGFIRIFLQPWKSPVPREVEQAKMSEFMNREVRARKAFKNWQDEWRSRYTTKMSATLAEAKVIEEEDTKGGAEQKEAPAEVEFEEKKKPEIPLWDKMKAQWVKMQQERIAETARFRKQTDKGKLEQMRKPLQIVEQENARKREKQKIAHSGAQKLFEETVKIYFPNYRKHVTSDLYDPYSEVYSSDTLDTAYKGYVDLSKKANKFLKENPFQYRFHWMNIVSLQSARAAKYQEIRPLEGIEYETSLHSTESSKSDVSTLYDYD